MNPLDLFNQVKELIEKKDLATAKTFVEENKDQLGEYLSQAQSLISGSEGIGNYICDCSGAGKIPPGHAEPSGKFLTDRWGNGHSGGDIGSQQEDDSEKGREVSCKDIWIHGEYFCQGEQYIYDGHDRALL